MLFQIVAFTPFFIYYYFVFDVTPQNKSFMCLLASSLSLATMIHNHSFIFTEPFKHDFMVETTNTFTSFYLVTDLIQTVYRGYFYREKVRGEILFHHIVCLNTFYFCNTLCSSVLTFAEILSIFPYFTNNRKIINCGRMIAIFPVRFCIWLYSINIIYSFHLPRITYTIPLLMYCLDIYWFSKCWPV